MTFRCRKNTNQLQKQQSMGCNEKMPQDQQENGQSGNTEKQYVEDLWCISGDFNNIRDSAEKVGVCQRTIEESSIKEFNDWINELEVVEAPWEETKFTWFRPNDSLSLQTGSHSHDGGNIGHALPLPSGRWNFKDPTGKGNVP